MDGLRRSNLHFVLSFCVERRTLFEKTGAIICASFRNVSKFEFQCFSIAFGSVSVIVGIHGRQKKTFIHLRLGIVKVLTETYHTGGKGIFHTQNPEGRKIYLMDLKDLQNSFIFFS